MTPFASPHQIYNPRFAANADLSHLTENMSLNNNHSSPSSTSGGQTPGQNSPQSPTPAYSRVDRTASRYAMIDSTAGKQNNGIKNAQPYPMEARFSNSISQPPEIASTWATNAASNQANANLQAAENNFPAPMSSQLDAATAFAQAIQLTMCQPGAQSGQGFNPIDLPQTIITERSLQNSSYYAFYRGNGQYTRLVPLDELPPIAGFPATGPMNGMIILPIPRQHQAIKIPQWVQQVQGPLTPNSTPSTGGSMESGRHFDAFAPVGHTPGGPFAGAATYAARAVPGPGIGGGSIRSFSNNATPARREKIYCDKWVHDGVCAFAQQRCKYKHEMPLDVPTQRSLGLFHGLPAWWKREHGLEMKRAEGGLDGEKKVGDRRASSVERHHESVRESFRGPSSVDRGLGGGLSSWRLPVQKGSSNSNSALSQNVVPRACGLFGNIGSRSTSSKSGLSNSYSILDVEDITSPVSSNSGMGGKNNGGITASMHAPFSPTPANGHNAHAKLHAKSEASGNGHGAFSSQEGK